MDATEEVIIIPPPEIKVFVDKTAEYATFSIGLLYSASTHDHSASLKICCHCGAVV